MFDPDKEPFFDPARNWVAALHKVTLYEKMSKMVATFWIHSSRQLATCLKIFKSFGIVQYIGIK